MHVVRSDVSSQLFGFYSSLLMVIAVSKFKSSQLGRPVGEAAVQASPHCGDPTRPCFLAMAMAVSPRGFGGNPRGNETGKWAG